MRTPLKHIAIHEAGHAVAALIVGERILELALAPWGKKEIPRARGYCWSCEETRPWLRRWDYEEHAPLTVMLAGPAATRIISRLKVREARTAERHDRWSASRIPIQIDSPLVGHFMWDLPDRELLETYERQAVEIVGFQRRGIVMLAKYLLQKKVLRGDEARAFVWPYLR